MVPVVVSSSEPLPASVPVVFHVLRYVRSYVFPCLGWYLCSVVQKVLLPTNHELEQGLQDGEVEVALRESILRCIFNGGLVIVKFVLMVWVASRYPLDSSTGGPVEYMNVFYINQFGILKVSLLWIIFFIIWSTLAFLFAGPRGGRVIGLFGVYLFGFLYLLPRAVKHWTVSVNYCPSPRSYVSFPFRGVLLGLPLIIANNMIVTTLLKVAIPDNVALIYPLIISAVEWVAPFILNNRVVEVHSDISIAILSRLATVIFDGLRVGLLVMIVNTGGSYQGLLSAVLMSAVLEALSNNGLFSIVRKGLRIFAGSLWAVAEGFEDKVTVQSGTTVKVVHPGRADQGDHKVESDRRSDGRWQQGDMRNGFNSLISLIDKVARATAKAEKRRWRRVYDSCKVHGRYMAVYALVVMKLTKFGPAAAVDEGTGELIGFLDCSWGVLAILFGGEVLTDVLTEVVRRCVARWVPALTVERSFISAGRSWMLHILLTISMASSAGSTMAGFASLSGKMEEASLAANKG